MPETIEQYIKRILGYSKGKNALKIQEATPARLSRVVKRVTNQGMMKKHSAGKWSIAELLAHLAEGEIVTSYRLRSILSSNGTAIQAYDQTAWVRNSFYLKRHPEESLLLFRTLRKNNIALLKSIPRKMWQFHGMHSERGKETIERLVNMIAGHDLNHLKQIEEIVKKKRA